MNCNYSMTCFRLYKYAKETREAQKAYFRTRDPGDLRTAKALERELDKAIDNYARVVLNQQPPQPTQPTLFSRERGDCAKLREAVKCLMDNLNIHLMQPSELITVNRAELDGMVMVCEAALSAPPRNCDKVKTSWDVLKEWHEGLDTANDIVRLLDWLLAPATKKDGGAK